MVIALDTPTDPADAAERRQVQEPLIVGVGVLPDEERGVLDVVGICEPDERAIAGLPRSLEGKQRQDPLAHAPLPGEEAHPHLGTRVPARIAILDLLRHPLGCLGAL